MACLNACKKKEDPAPTPRRELLASTSGKKWKITSVTVGSANAIEQTFPNACERDNLYVFYTDKKLVIEEGAVPCNPSTAATGTWSLSADEKTLTITGTGSSFNGNFTIIQIENTTLKATVPYQGVTANVTLAAQ
jgi:hypothetical protein